MADMKTQPGFVVSRARWRRCPPSLFAIPFGVAGLVEAWDAG